MAHMPLLPAGLDHGVLAGMGRMVPEEPLGLAPLSDQAPGMLWVPRPRQQSFLGGQSPVT